uniref:Uncharacterized protein n=1 Tax=Glossina brevipalpis TaxID=37001 RepID=A0A1A9WVG2_9MUSC
MSACEVAMVDSYPKPICKLSSVYWHVVKSRHLSCSLVNRTSDKQPDRSADSHPWCDKTIICTLLLVWLVYMILHIQSRVKNRQDLKIKLNVSGLLVKVHYSDQDEELNCYGYTDCGLYKKK